MGWPLPLDPQYVLQSGALSPPPAIPRNVLGRPKLSDNLKGFSFIRVRKEESYGGKYNKIKELNYK